MCDTTSDQDTLLTCGDSIMPWGPMTLYVTSAHTMDAMLRTSLPREVRIALRTHKALFYQGGGLVLSVVSSIPITPASVF